MSCPPSNKPPSFTLFLSIFCLLSGCCLSDFERLAVCVFRGSISLQRLSFSAFFLYSLLKSIICFSLSFSSFTCSKAPLRAAFSFCSCSRHSVIWELTLCSLARASSGAAFAICSWCTQHYQKRAERIIRDTLHPAHSLLKHKHCSYNLRHRRADSITTNRTRFLRASSLPQWDSWPKQNELMSWPTS